MWQDLQCGWWRLGPSLIASNLTHLRLSFRQKSTLLRFYLIFTSSVVRVFTSEWLLLVCVVPVPTINITCIVGYMNIQPVSCWPLLKSACCFDGIHQPATPADSSSTQMNSILHALYVNRGSDALCLEIQKLWSILIHYSICSGNVASGQSNLVYQKKRLNRLQSVALPFLKAFKTLNKQA